MHEREPRSWLSHSKRPFVPTSAQPLVDDGLEPLGQDPARVEREGGAVREVHLGVDAIVRVDPVVLEQGVLGPRGVDGLRLRLEDPSDEVVEVHAQEPGRVRRMGPSAGTTRPGPRCGPPYGRCRRGYRRGRRPGRAARWPGDRDRSACGNRPEEGLPRPGPRGRSRPRPRRSRPGVSRPGRASRPGRPRRRSPDGGSRAWRR